MEEPHFKVGTEEVAPTEKPLPLLPLPATDERGAGREEGSAQPERPSSPRPSPPAAGGEGEAGGRLFRVPFDSIAAGSGTAGLRRTTPAGTL